MSADRILALFNPAMQMQYCRDVDRVFFGRAPRISILAEAYGRNAAESWLEIQINDLSEFAGCRDKLSIDQIRETAAMILEEYPHYNLAEFMLFFQHFKRCKYGKFYGTVDPMVIMQALDSFNDYRRSVHREHRHAEEQRRLAESEEQRRKERAEQELRTIRQRYISRVPDAFAPEAPVSFLQYRLMDLDAMTDKDLATLIADIRAGKRKLPTDFRQMLKIINHSKTSRI